MGDTVVSVERVIDAPAAAIFAIVADPSRHPEIDGSGSVKGLKGDAPRQLALGSTFGMSMKLGLPYSMSNTVIEFDQDKQRFMLKAGPVGKQTADAMTKTLERLAELTESSSGGT